MDTEAIQESFKRLHVALSSDAINSMRHVAGIQASACITPERVLYHVLRVPLKYVTTHGTLPKSDQVRNQKLDGNWLLEVAECIDVHQSWQQKCAEEKKSSGDEHRMLRLLVTDGYTELPAMELIRIQSIGSIIGKGSKLLVRDVAIIQGLLVLTPQNCVVLHTVELPSNSEQIIASPNHNQTEITCSDKSFQLRKNSLEAAPIVSHMTPQPLVNMSHQPYSLQKNPISSSCNAQVNVSSLKQHHAGKVTQNSTIPNQLIANPSPITVTSIVSRTADHSATKYPESKLIDISSPVLPSQDDIIPILEEVEEQEFPWLRDESPALPGSSKVQYEAHLAQPIKRTRTSLKEMHAALERVKASASSNIESKSSARHPNFNESCSSSSLITVTEHHTKDELQDIRKICGVGRAVIADGIDASFVTSLQPRQHTLNLLPTTASLPSASRNSNFEKVTSATDATDISFQGAEQSLQTKLSTTDGGQQGLDDYSNDDEELTILSSSIISPPKEISPPPLPIQQTPWVYLAQLQVYFMQRCVQVARVKGLIGEIASFKNINSQYRLKVWLDDGTKPTLVTFEAIVVTDLFECSAATLEGLSKEERSRVSDRAMKALADSEGIFTLQIDPLSLDLTPKVTAINRVETKHVQQLRDSLDGLAMH